MFRAFVTAAAGLALYAGLAIGASPEVRVPTGHVVGGPQLSQLLALTGGMSDGSLVQLDPSTLEPLRGKRIPVGSGGCASSGGGTACWSPAWAVSPDAKRLVLAESTPLGLRDAASIRLVDPATMRAAAKIPVPGGVIGGLAWLRPDRILAVQELPGEKQRVVAFDLAGRRVVARHALDGSVVRLASTAHELVAVVAPARAIGPARIAVADARGAVRSVRLDRILAGSRTLGGEELRIDSRSPGLALDPTGRRAFVVAKGIAAEIDLRTLAVSYHDLDHEASFLSKLWSWLDPAALAKEFSGQSRDARWLGDGLLAVSGSDARRGEMRPAGLVVVDTRSWKVQTIDPGATSFELAGDVLVATGGTSDGQRERGIGLAVYGPNGTLRFRLFDGRQVWAQAYLGRVFVGVPDRQALRVVDLATGSVVGTRSPDLPSPLLGTSGGRWG